MKPIQFEHIPDVGLSLDRHFTAEQLSEFLKEPGRELCFTATEPTEVHFYLERKGANARVTGGGQFKLLHPCVRCLEDVMLNFALSFDTELEKPKAIDLEEVMREELFLELPTYPACEPACLK